MATASLSDGKQACAHFADEKTEAAAAVLLLQAKPALSHVTFVPLQLGCFQLALVWPLRAVSVPRRAV